MASNNNEDFISLLSNNTERVADELSQIEEAIDAYKVLMARDDICAFAEYVMVDEYGKLWSVPQHQREWFSLLDSSINRLLLIAPRGHAKSTTVLAYILYAIGKNPNISIKYVCGDDDLAIDMLQMVKDNIKNNKRYQKVFPHVKPADEGEWTKHKIFIERPASLGLKDATIQAFGVTASGTGGRAHIIIFDDIIDSRSAIISPSLLQKIEHLVSFDWLNLLFPGGRAIMIGTFWSFDPPDIYVKYARKAHDITNVSHKDIRTYEKNPSQWFLWKRPAIYNNEPIWPEKWPQEALEAKKKENVLAFMQQFLLEGAIGKTEYFSEENISKCLRNDIALGEGYDKDWPRYVGVDPASSLRRSSSFSSIFLIAVSPDGVKIPINIWREKLRPEQVANLIIDIYNNYKPNIILVENNGYQTALEDLIRVLARERGMNDMQLPLAGKFTGSQKWSPDVGLPQLHIEMASGKWIIPFAGDHTLPGHSCVVCNWLKEMREFPFGDTTDIIMSMWLANTAASDMGVFTDIPVIGYKATKNLRF